MKAAHAALAGLGVVVALTTESGRRRTAEDILPASPDLVSAVRGNPGPHPSPSVPPDELTRVVQRTCLSCHNDRMRTGNLSLEGFDVAAVAESAEAAEKIIGKLRLGMMPPPGMPRPGGDTLLSLVETLERDLDAAYARDPAPGYRGFQRLNRAEYARVIRDLMGVEIDPADFLPADQISQHFDNDADVQTISATLMDGYLNAASEIARVALGHPTAQRTDRTYSIPRFVSQHEWTRIEGAPYGTRGGISVIHTFPADGHYVFDLKFLSGWGEKALHDVDVSINGERVALLPYGGEVDFQGRGDFPIRTDPVFVSAGQHRVTAAFIRRMEGPYADLLQPNEWSLTGTEVSYGTTSLPHLRELTITGPHDPTGVSEPSTRENILTCEPGSSLEERACGEEILFGLATRAYRRPLTERDRSALMTFYDKGAERGGFEGGIKGGVEAILASPYFLFRFEGEPDDAAGGDVFRIDDLELASRLSFFLWGSVPDDELLEVAAYGRLSDPDVLEAQTRRMLADTRSEALATRFAAQWLRLQDLERVKPDVFWFPDYDQQLGQLMKRETELFFIDLVRQDRSLLDLYRADYTFVNERLARHYGIPGVIGNHFQRVRYPEHGGRKGIFGHGSVLVLTSLGNRTSPVLRGLWIMEVLLDSPPPPPPPAVPDLEATVAARDGRELTTRERLEIHRSSPTCNSCHQFIDPLGLALDNFDVTGAWRIRERSAPLDTRGELWDGTPVASAAELSEALLARPLPVVRTFTKNLLTYALGRRTDYRDGPTIRRIARDAAEEDYRLSSFILGVVDSDAFQMKRRESTVEDAGSR